MPISALERVQFRKLRVRSKIRGTEDRPRLSVYRSLKHIYAQLIDDEQEKTVVSASSLDPSIRSHHSKKSKTEIAHLVGEHIAKKAKEAKIKRVVFDRGGGAYHGRIQALAEGARAGGLEF